MLDEPSWGEAPDADLLEGLVRERYPLGAEERVALRVDLDPRALELDLTVGPHLYTLRVHYLRGAGANRDPWTLMLDALDALYATLRENGRDYRALPRGNDVIHGGAAFDVRVEHHQLDLEKLANQILERGNLS